MQTKGTRRGVDFQKYDTFIVTGIEVCIPVIGMKESSAKSIIDHL